MKKYLEKGIRVDGRKFLDVRDVMVETGVSKNAEGSARVKIGETEVLAGVKMNVGVPYPDSADQGILITGAELLPLSSPEFESGPPSVWATEVARVVDRGIRESKMIDMKKMCIRKGELVWTVFLDIYTINDAGNLIDASALAAVAALKSAVFPKLDGDRVLFGEFTKDKVPLTKTPVNCTIFKVEDSFIVDVLSEEEKVASARLSVSVGEKDEIYAMQKGGDEGLLIEEADGMVGAAQEVSKVYRESLKKIK